MKKLLSIIFSAFFIMSCCFVNAFSVNCKNKESNRVLSRSEIIEANKSISPTSTDDKRTFVNCVFSELGFDSRYVSLLNDNLLEKFASAEEYGFCEKADLSPSSESSVLSNNGSNTKHYEKMDLAIIWARNNNEYTILGSYEWNTVPVMRYKDIISIDLGSGSIVKNSQVAVLQYTKNNATYSDEYNAASSEYQGVKTACTFKINLPNSASSMSALIGYSIKTSNPDNTITSQYFHNWCPLPFGVSISYIGGISVSPQSFFTEYNLQCGT